MRPLTKPEILSLLQKFLPSGAAWPRALGTVLSSLLESFAHGMAQMDLRLQELLAEINPSTASALLPEWEAFVALPDECCTLTSAPLDERQRLVVSRLTDVGSLSRAYFLQMATDLGYQDVAITEFRPTHCEMTCEVPVMDERFRFLWQVNLPRQGNNYTVFRVGARCDERLDRYAFGSLECQLMRLKPAHTQIIFTYKELADEAN
ncbi:YmfQ family protein [Janthinobacterium sp. BJB301]|uniref:YmfQ family protein n=1 Tax=Janthinobacterium sp. BJB301 TaxID=1560195 RepID=UPI0015D4A3E8|nr:putative phage tail protein [Janthinobacterium sp. BJB301]